MSFYDDLVEVSKEYFGFGSVLFVNRVLREMSVSKDSLKKSDIPKFVGLIDKLAKTSLKPERKAQFKKDVLALQ